MWQNMPRLSVNIEFLTIIKKKKIVFEKHVDPCLHVDIYVTYYKNHIISQMLKK